MGNYCFRNRRTRSDIDWAVDDGAADAESRPRDWFIVFGQNALGRSFLTTFNSSRRRLDHVRTSHLPKFYNYSGVTTKDEDTIIICGGIQSNLDVISSECLEFDLQKRTFRQLPDMISYRYTFPVVYHQRRIYALGGRVDGNDEVSLLNACEVYSYDANEWRPIAPMHLRRCTFSAFVYDGRIWALGGYSGNLVRSKVIEAYDPMRDVWTRTDVKLIEGFENGNIATHPARPNELIVFGGKLKHGGSRSVWTYNLREQTVLSHPPLLFEAVLSKVQFCQGTQGLEASFATQLWGDEVVFQSYDLEGMNALGSTTQPLRLVHPALERFKQYNYNATNVEVTHGSGEGDSRLLPTDDCTLIFGTDLDPFQLQISATTAQVRVCPVPIRLRLRLYQSCVRVGPGRLLFCGGTNSAHSKIYGTTLLYEPGRNRVEKLAPMPNPRYMITSIFHENSVIVIGGRDYGPDVSSYLRYCERFDLVRNRWEPMPNLNEARCLAAGFVVEGRIFVAGGMSADAQSLEKKLSSIEYFNAVRQRWELTGFELHIPMYGFSYSLRGCELFYFGGFASDDSAAKHVIDLSQQDMAVPTPLSVSSLYYRTSVGKMAPVGKLLFLFGGTERNGIDALLNSDFSCADEKAALFDAVDEKRGSQIVRHFRTKLRMALERVAYPAEVFLKPNCWTGPLQSRTF